MISRPVRPNPNEAACMVDICLQRQGLWGLRPRRWSWHLFQEFLTLHCSGCKYSSYHLHRVFFYSPTSRPFCPFKSAHPLLIVTVRLGSNVKPRWRPELTRKKQLGAHQSPSIEFRSAAKIDGVSKLDKKKSLQKSRSLYPSELPVGFSSYSNVIERKIPLWHCQHSPPDTPGSC
jgi:hypothetical protein